MCFKTGKGYLVRRIFGFNAPNVIDVFPKNTPAFCAAGALGAVQRT